MKTIRYAAAAVVAAIALAPALAGGPAPVPAQAMPAAPAERRLVRIEARFVDGAGGQEAPWGATGQILVPVAPADSAVARWGQARAVASSTSQQSVTLAAGGRGLIRVGREIPFAGWFLRQGLRCGQLEERTEWRDVESAFEIEAGAAADGTVRLLLTPEFGYAQGRARRTVSFPAERVEVLLVPGAETRLAPPAERRGFYRRLLAGYDPLRRVWSVEMLLRAELVEP
ncbi:MAG TPA: hypothetical protein VN317_09200 [Candidatus Methanoperedens sp.]|nr:hypothetical protein [Candidatus Methanoperedens sp.]